MVKCRGSPKRTPGTRQAFPFEGPELTAGAPSPQGPSRRANGRCIELGRNDHSSKGKAIVVWFSIPESRDPRGLGEESPGIRGHSAR